MSVLRRTLFAAPVAFAFVASSASSVAALPPEGRTLFTWSGRVDREVILAVRGRSVETRASGVDASFAPRLEVRDDLPRAGGDIDVQLAGGRGSVEVLQNPSARNDYTALVRVWDSRAGSDNYRVVVSWRPAVVIDARDRDRDRDRDDDWDRGKGNNGRGNGNGNGRGNGRDNDDWDNRGRGRRDDGRLAFRGLVDDVAEIRIQGREIDYRTRSGQPLRNVRTDILGAPLPRHGVTLAVNVLRGRGEVELVQQPSARNGYTAILRVVDRRSGYGDYDFYLEWY